MNSVYSNVLYDASGHWLKTIYVCPICSYAKEVTSSKYSHSFSVDVKYSSIDDSSHRKTVTYDCTGCGYYETTTTTESHRKSSTTTYAYLDETRHKVTVKYTCGDCKWTKTTTTNDYHKFPAGSDTCSACHYKRVTPPTFDNITMTVHSLTDRQIVPVAGQTYWVMGNTALDLHVAAMDNARMKSLQVKLDGGTVATYAPSNPSAQLARDFSLPVPADGSHQLEIIAIDYVGNTSSRACTLRCDGSRPLIEAYTVNNGEPYTRNTSVPVRIAAADLDSGPGRLYLSAGGAPGTWIEAGDLSAGELSVDWALASAEGPHTVYAAITDQAGNYTVASALVTLDTVAPSVPADIAVSRDIDARTVTLSWSPVEDPAPGSGFSGYRVQYCMNDGDWQEEAALIADSAWTKGSLTAADVISFRIRAEDGAGNVSDWSGVTAPVCLAAYAPVRVASLTSTAQSAGGAPQYIVTINISPVADTVGYRYYRRDADGAVTALTPAGTTALSYIDTDLAAHAVYEYGYTTYNALGEESAVKWGDPQTVCDPALQAPRILVRNLPPAVIVGGPDAGTVLLEQEVPFILDAAVDVEGDWLEYRLYRRAPGAGQGALAAVWTPTVDGEAVTVVFPEGNWEWQIRCIETDAGLVPDRTETVGTGWTALTIRLAQSTVTIITQPYCLDVFDEPNRGTKGQPLAFTAAAVDDQGGDLTYTWNFGDGTAPATGREVGHAFTALGTFTVTVDIASSQGGTARAEAEVFIENTARGRLYANETWCGTHAVTGDVLVPAGITLTLAPGATVLCEPGSGINVQGALWAEDAAGGITLDRRADTTESWRGIRFDSAGMGVLTGLTIQNAERGVACTGNGTVTITACVFTANQAGLHCYNSSPAITDCTFTDNLIYGIKEDGAAAPVVRDCRFSGNGAGDYYDTELTIITPAELNGLGENGGNS